MVSLNSYNTSPNTNKTTTSGWRDEGYYESSKIKRRQRKGHDHLIRNNPYTKTKAGIHKFVNAFTTYPAKGLRGDENSSFYEFLAMGTVPYVVGSLTLVSVFNSASTGFLPRSAKEAKKVGKHLGIGVALYAIAKEIGKKTVNEPVRLATGIDLDRPYKKVVYELPPNATEKGKKRVEYHKVFESVDFPRWDLLYADGLERHGNRNYHFDKLAKRSGQKDLHSSDQEMKPKIKTLATKARTWKMLTGYLWAAAAVGLAAQSPWEDALVEKGMQRTFKERVNDAPKKYADIMKRSFKEMWDGGVKKSASSKVMGRGLILAALGSSVIGTMSSISGFRSQPKTQNVIKKNQKVYES